MGCNCKGGKKQVLNNLDSQDHLKVAFDVYEEIIKPKTEPIVWDAADANVLLQTFYTVYPNAKIQVTPEHAASSIKEIYNQYYGRK